MFRSKDYIIIVIYMKTVSTPKNMQNGKVRHKKIKQNMKNTILLLAVLAIISYSRPASFQSGGDASVVWASPAKHILHSGNNVPRSVDVVITFAKKFSMRPKVALSTFLLDWQDSPPAGFHFKLNLVNRKKIIVRVSAIGARQLYSVFINWIAIDDPRIRVQYFETKDTRTLITVAEGMRQESYTIPYRKKTFTNTPAVATFLNGVHFTKPNNLVFIYPEALQTDKTNLVVKTWYTTGIAMVRVCLVIGEKSMVWSSPIMSFRIPSGEHGWLKRGPSESVVGTQIDLPPSTANNGHLYGFTGFDSDIGRNHRSQIKDFAIANNQATGKLSTWWDSLTYQMSWQLVRYIFDDKYDITKADDDSSDDEAYDATEDDRDDDEKPKPVVQTEVCAYLYSECGYKGESFKICDKSNSFPADGWNKEIKSIKVPAGRTLTLYTDVNLQGKKVSFTSDQECLSGFTFNMLQVALTQ